MKCPFSVIILFIILVITINHLLLHNGRRRRRHLPPGPLPLPIIGNLHQLSLLPHRQLRNLSYTYGPIMLIHLGNIPTIVVSSPRAAELFLKTHDAVFSSRPRIGVLDFIPQWKGSLLLSPNNAYWRQMRRLCTQELLNEAKVREFGKARMEVLVKMVNGLRRMEKDGGNNVIDLSRIVADAMEELMCRMVMSCDDGKMEGFELGEVVQEMLRLVGKFNIEDYIPFFRQFDLLGLGRRAKEVNKVLHKMLEAIVSGHEQNAPSRHRKNFIDLLLAVMNKPVSKLAHDEMSDYYIVDRSSIKAIMLDIIGGGIETTSTTVDWALSEIIRNHRVLKGLQDELDEVVGQNRMVEECDMPKLGYLELVVKETLRLHPPGPLIVPHESTEDVVVDGYFIPKGARVLINVWAIGRDADVWSTDAEEFCPERFEGLKVDFRRHNFEFLPFGSGRRSCPGMSMGLAMVKLSIAQLVHCFDWEMPKGMSPSDIDMTEEFGLSVPRANHLCLIPRYRLLD